MRGFGLSMRTQVQRKVSFVCVALAVGCNDADPSPGQSISDSAPSGDATTEEPTATDGSTTMGTGTLGSGTGSGGTAGLVAEIDCAEPPAAAVDAEYDHQLALVDDHGVSWTWAVSGLPPGMTLAPLTGRLSGAPTEEGSFEIEVTVSHPEGDGMGTCTIDVAPRLSIDFDALGGPCVTPDVSIEDFVVGGDGSPLHCTTPGGSGEGRLPTGIVVDPDSCAATGTADDDYGTWAWITRVEQSGLRVPVPYCFTIEEQDPGAYTIVGDHSGGTDNALQPAMRTFVPGEPLAFGGDGDPLFVVTQDSALAAIHFHYAFNVAASPFGDCGRSDCFGLDPSVVVMNGDGDRVGFSHELWALGDPPPEELEDRPWVFTLRTFYCISDNETDCNDANYEANGNGELRFSAIFFPE
jgi:hypothetical protein